MQPKSRKPPRLKRAPSSSGTGDSGGKTLSSILRIERRLAIPRDEEEVWKHVAGHSGEVAFAVATANGRVLLQRKRHYPADVYRLPTGRLRPGETAEAALAREVLEETGLVVRRAWDLAVIRFRMDYEGRTSDFETRLFAVETFPGALSPRDRSEGIVGYLAVSIEQVPRHWWKLRNLPAPLRAWGRWRAVPLAVLRATLRRGRLFSNLGD